MQNLPVNTKVGVCLLGSCGKTQDWVETWFMMWACDSIYLDAVGMPEVSIHAKLLCLFLVLCYTCMYKSQQHQAASTNRYNSKHTDQQSVTHTTQRASSTYMSWDVSTYTALAQALPLVSMLHLQTPLEVHQSQQ